MASLSNQAVINVADCRLTGNEAGFGGGMTASASSGGIVNVTSCWFGENIAHECCDTGIWWTECYVDGLENDLYFGGGADMRTFGPGSEINVANCVFANNDAVRAGGAHFGVCDGGTINVVNSTSVNNTAAGFHLRLGTGFLNASGKVIVANSIVPGNDSQVEIELRGRRSRRRRQRRHGRLDPLAGRLGAMRRMR